MDPHEFANLHGVVTTVPFSSFDQNPFGLDEYDLTANTTAGDTFYTFSAPAPEPPLTSAGVVIYPNL